MSTDNLALTQRIYDHTKHHNGEDGISPDTLDLLDEAMNELHSMADEIERLRARTYKLQADIAYLEGWKAYVEENHHPQFVETNDEVLDKDGNPHWGWYRVVTP